MKQKLFIGVVTTECYYEYERELLKGIISQAFKASCDICVIAKMHRYKTPESDHTKSEDIIYDLILSDRFDGFIYDRDVFSDEPLARRIDELLKKSGRPVILLSNSENRYFEYAAIDDSEAFEKITDHLIEKHGCRKIYCLTGPKGIKCSEERLNGYISSMDKHKLPHKKSWYFYGDFWKAAPAVLAEKIISGSLEKPDAIVCGNDIMAAELCNAFMNHGISVPDDIKLTGFDGFDYDFGTTVTITSYKRSHFQLGAEAFRHIYRIITGNICKRVHNEVNELIPGQSCGCGNADRVFDSEKKRHDKVEKMFSYYMRYSSMLIDICNIDDLDTMMIRAGWYSYLIYKLGRLSICLTDKYIRSVKSDYRGPLTFTGDEKMHMVLNKIPMHDLECPDQTFDIMDIIPDFGESKDGRRKRPSAYYVSLLHNNYDYFGYALLSFGKNPTSFDVIYLDFIKYLNTALKCLYDKNQIRLSEIMENNRHYRDSSTGFLNLRGLQSIFLDPDRKCGRVFALFETEDMLSFYIPSTPNSPDYSSAVRQIFADSIESVISDGDIAAVISDGAYFLEVNDAKKPEIIFDNIVKKLSGSDEMKNCPVSFSLGIYKADPDEMIGSLKSVMYHTRANKVRNYSNKEVNETNPQREKLELLRSSMMKHPERQWKIESIAEEMFISRSYLQKLYRRTFGKSIIEELIGFRIEKAMEILVNTDRSISETAFDCGYSSYTYFTRQFSEFTGMSPSDFRKENRKKKAERKD